MNLGPVDRPKRDGDEYFAALLQLELRQIQPREWPDAPKREPLSMIEWMVLTPVALMLILTLHEMFNLITGRQ